jgi:hypothetical protein
LSFHGATNSEKLSVPLEPDYVRGGTLSATGASVIPLASFGELGRPRWQVEGAGAKFTAAFWIVAKEQRPSAHR